MAIPRFALSASRGKNSLTNPRRRHCVTLPRFLAPLVTDLLMLKTRVERLLSRRVVWGLGVSTQTVTWLWTQCGSDNVCMNDWRCCIAEWLIINVSRSIVHACWLVWSRSLETRRLSVETRPLGHWSLVIGEPSSCIDLRYFSEACNLTIWSERTLMLSAGCEQQ